jgi:SAM-dependent methyltransferase
MEAEISEIKRALKPGGILFLSTISRKQWAFGRGRETEPFTYINTPGLPDGKEPHHYFTIEELQEYFREFEILKIKENSRPPVKDDFWQHGLEEIILIAQR